MRLTSVLALGLLLGAALGTETARADDADARAAELDTLHQQVDKLEQRIAELELQKSTPTYGGGSAASWAERVRLSGSATLDYLNGGQYGLYDHGSTKLFDARMFLDADLARDVRIGDATAFRDAGFSFEWNIYRLGYFANNVGDLYVDFRGIGDNDWLNFQAGRFQIPFGENYLRFGRGYYTDPFIALSAPPPWFWDEGVKLWGKMFEDKASYAFAVTTGESAVNNVANGSAQLSLKLAADPWEWLHVSASALRSGVVGSDTSPAVAAVWLGEVLPRSFGAGTGVQSFQNGAPIAPGPNKLQNIWILGGDAIVKSQDTRLWLSYGGAKIDSSGGTTYDRDLIYWLAELMVQLRLVSPSLSPAYVAVRASGLGTYSDNRGYLLDIRDGAIGYNMNQLDTYALVVGLPIGDHITLKGQYAYQNIGLVKGVTVESIKDAADHPSFYGMEIGVHF